MTTEVTDKSKIDSLLELLYEIKDDIENETEEDAANGGSPLTRSRIHKALDLVFEIDQETAKT